MHFARRVFLIAAIYGIVGLVPQYFLEDKTGRDHPPAITHPEFFYGFTGVALAFQFLFLIIAHDPPRYRQAMLPGAMEKVAFGASTLVLYLRGRLAAPMVGFGIVDLVFAALFLVAYRMTR